MKNPGYSEEFRETVSQSKKGGQKRQVEGAGRETLVLWPGWDFLEKGCSGLSLYYVVKIVFGGAVLG